MDEFTDVSFNDFRIPVDALTISATEMPDSRRLIWDGNETDNWVVTSDGTALNPCAIAS